MPPSDVWKHYESGLSSQWESLLKRNPVLPSVLVTWFTLMYEQIGAYFTYVIYLIAFSIVRISFFNSCFLRIYRYNNMLLTLNMRGPSYLGLTRSISWLLMLWLLASPGHPEQWYWLCRIGRSLSYSRKDFNYLCHINAKEWHQLTSNGSWRQGIKGEMTCTVYVALVWNIIYWIMMIITLFTE